jgi:hypothetical protein
MSEITRTSGTTGDMLTQDGEYIYTKYPRLPHESFGDHMARVHEIVGFPYSNIAIMERCEPEIGAEMRRRHTEFERECGQDALLEKAEVVGED